MTIIGPRTVEEQEMSEEFYRTTCTCRSHFTHESKTCPRYVEEQELLKEQDSTELETAEEQPHQVAIDDARARQKELIHIMETTRSQANAALRELIEFELENEDLLNGVY